MQQPFQSGVDAVSSLMVVVVGIGAKKVIELYWSFVQSHAEIQLGHCQLILIGEENAFGSIIAQVSIPWLS